MMQLYLFFLFTCCYATASAWCDDCTSHFSMCIDGKSEEVRCPCLADLIGCVREQKCPPDDKWIAELCKEFQCEHDTVKECCLKSISSTDSCPQWLLTILIFIILAGSLLLAYFVKLHFEGNRPQPLESGAQPSEDGMVYLDSR